MGPPSSSSSSPWCPRRAKGSLGRLFGQNKLRRQKLPSLLAAASQRARVTFAISRCIPCRASLAVRVEEKCGSVSRNLGSSVFVRVCVYMCVSVCARALFCGSFASVHLAPEQRCERTRLYYLLHSQKEIWTVLDWVSVGSAVTSVRIGRFQSSICGSSDLCLPQSSTWVMGSLNEEGIYGSFHFILLYFSAWTIKRSH